MSAIANCLYLARGQLVQQDMKNSLIALFVRWAHMGFVTMGIFKPFNPAKGAGNGGDPLDDQPLASSLPRLFPVRGVIYDRMHTRRD